MSSLDNIIKQTENVTLVAATKYVDSRQMLKLLDYNIVNFGENRVDSFLQKYEELKDYNQIKWHFIGTLQTNKVKKMINKISYLHSLNSIKLASFIDKYRTSPLDCFLEINLTRSSTKTGILPNEVIDTLNQIKNFKNVNIIGLMTMTEPNMTDKEKEQIFNKLNSLKQELNNLGFLNIKELSMGMSDDYLIAISSGATFVRLGRILFSK